MASFESYCVAPFKQRYPIQRMFPADHEVQSGICFGLSLEWMARHRANKGETSKSRIAYIEKDNTILHASIKQRLYGTELHHQLDLSTAQLGSRGEAMQHAGLAITGTTEQWVDVTDPDNMKEVMKAISIATSGTHSYHMITLIFTQRGAAHATCCYKSGGKAFGMGSHLYFFEPNYGEFKASSGSAADLFSGLVGRYRKYEKADGSFADHRVAKIVVQGISAG